MKFFFIILFLVVQNTQAIEITEDAISSESYFIQVGAFKSMSNIEKVKDKLFEYEIYLEPYKNMHRVHVVNILSLRVKETLAELKTIYPKAFISKRPKISRKSSANFNELFKPSTSKVESIKSYEPSLDSRTILRTRKSFL